MTFFEAFVNEMDKIAQGVGIQPGMSTPPMPEFKKVPLMGSGAQVKMQQARKQMAFAPTGLPTGQSPAAPKMR